MKTKLIIFTGLILLSSGCLNGGSSSPDETPNKGLVVEEFSVSDSELRTGQQATITAILNNYHTNLDNLQISIANAGILDVSDKDCNPSASELRDFSMKPAPQIQCTWTVEAPGEESMSGFPDKSKEVIMRVSYDATLENLNGFNVQFKQGSDIEKTSTVSTSFSNGEVAASAIVDEPVNINTGNILELEVSNEGKGRLEGGYQVDYNPSSYFEDCSEGGEPIGGSSWTGTCTLNADDSFTDSLFFTIHYKYVKSPVLDITVVNRQ